MHYVHIHIHTIPNEQTTPTTDKAENIINIGIYTYELNPYIHYICGYALGYVEYDA